jgi:hypothetical protein
MVEMFIDQPNLARWVVHFMEDPQRIIEYMAANCSTVTIGGDRPIDLFQIQDFGAYLGNAFSFCFFVPTQHRCV